jgi:hypothetical protein
MPEQLFAKARGGAEKKTRTPRGATQPAKHRRPVDVRSSNRSLRNSVSTIALFASAVQRLLTFEPHLRTTRLGRTPVIDGRPIAMS